MKLTLDTSTIGKKTLKGIRRQLLLELKANNAGQKNNTSAPHRCELRRQETQLITGISTLNVAIISQ